MKNLLFCLFAGAMSFMSFAQNQETRSLGDFTEIHVGEAIEVKLIKAGMNEALIETGKIDVSQVITDIRGNRLSIEIDNKKWNSSHGKVSIQLKYKDIDAIHVSSAAKVESDELFEANSIELRASSAGKLRVWKVICSDLEVKTSSAGKIQLDIVEAQKLDCRLSSAGKVKMEGGYAHNVKISASSSGNLDARELAVKNLKANVSSNGKVTVGEVSGSISGNASSLGKVSYKGAPNRDVSTSSGGAFKQQ